MDNMWLGRYPTKGMFVDQASSLIATTVISARRPDSYKARTTLRPERLFRDDLQDGSLEQLMLLPLPFFPISLA